MIFSIASVHKTQIAVLILRSKNLTIQVVKKLKLIVFTWRGFTPSDIYKEGTIQSLEALRHHPRVNRIILNKKDHAVILQEDIANSVKSTVDYLGIAQGNYRMAVIPPTDLLAKDSVDTYVNSLNHALKKRFVVKQHENTKKAVAWLTRPKLFDTFAK